MALSITYVLIPLASRLPNDVLVTTNAIVVGGVGIPFTQIEHAIVGSTTVGGREFHVLTFKTKAGQNYLYALGRKVNPVELTKFLEGVGLHEPRA